MKKPTKVMQVRISPELATRIDAMRDQSEFVISRPAFVEALLYRGIEFSKQSAVESDTGESSFKK